MRPHIGHVLGTCPILGAASERAMWTHKWQDGCSALLNCIMRHIPDQVNSPGDCFWMGWWGYAKREEFKGGCRHGPSRPPGPPRWPKTGSRRPQMQDDLRWPRDGPSGFQDGPKRLQESVQEGILQDGGLEESSRNQQNPSGPLEFLGGPGQRRGVCFQFGGTAAI